MELFSTETLGILLGVANLIIQIVSPKIIFLAILKPFRVAISKIRQPSEHDISIAKAIQALSETNEELLIRMEKIEEKVEESRMHYPFHEGFSKVSESKRIRARNQ